MESKECLSLPLFAHVLAFSQFAYLFNGSINPLVTTTTPFLPLILAFTEANNQLLSNNRGLYVGNPSNAHFCKTSFLLPTVWLTFPLLIVCLLIKPLLDLCQSNGLLVGNDNAPVLVI